MIQCYIIWYLLSYYIEDIVPAAASNHRWECMAAVHTPLGLQLTIWDLGPHLTHHGLQLTTCDRGPHLTIFTMTSWAFLTTIDAKPDKTQYAHMLGVLAHMWTLIQSSYMMSCSSLISNLGRALTYQERSGSHLAFFNFTDLVLLAIATMAEKRVPATDVKLERSAVDRSCQWTWTLILGKYSWERLHFPIS